MIHIITYMSTDSEINNCEHEQLLPEARVIRDENLITSVIRRSLQQLQKQ